MIRKTDAVVVRTIGIDTSKNTPHLIGLDDKGAIVLREKLSRGRITARLPKAPYCLIGIEAGMATHCVARELIALRHDVKEVPPVYARPFRQGHKNDFRDAHAVAEAVQRPSTRCVPVKTRSAGSASPASRAISPDQRADRSDQSDPRLSLEQPRASLSAAATPGHLG